MSIISVIGGNDFCIYNRPIANKLGVEVSILLGELASEQNYWTSRNHHDGFFYSTVENLMARTALSKGKIRSAVSTLSSLGILEIESRGIPRKRYFRINETVVTEFINNLSENSPVTDCFTSANCISQEDAKNESLDVSFEHAQEDSFSDPVPKSLVMQENNSNISPKSPSFQEHNPVACEVIDYLNRKANCRFCYTMSSTKDINKRIEEGFSKEEFFQVIDKMVPVWKDNPKMSRFLRPATLFGPKFESYLNAKYINGSSKRHDYLPDYYNPNPIRESSVEKAPPELVKEIKDLLLKNAKKEEENKCGA